MMVSELVSGTTLLHDLPDAKGTLVFGMRWSALVGSDVARLAGRRARAAQATHYVYGGQRGVCVGHIRLGRGACGQVLYSAAQALACAHPGVSIAAAVALPDGRIWVAGARDGAVLARTDRIYPSLASAMPVIQALRENLPDLIVTPPDGVSSLDDVMALLAVPAESAALRRARSGWRAWLLSLGGASICAISVIAATLWWQGRHARPDVREPDEAAAAARVAQQWRNATRAALAGIVLHPPAQLDALFASVSILPTALHGWVLRRVRCAGRLQMWTCRVHYDRTRTFATNEAFAQRTPSGWRVNFLPLEQASLVWRIPVQGAAADIDRLPSSAETNTRFASHLQSIRPAFSAMAIGPPQDLAIAAPRDERGAAMPSPADRPVLRQRRVEIAGPMRSFSIFHPVASLQWETLEIVLDGAQPSALAHSPLIAKLTGWVYEKE